MKKLLIFLFVLSFASVMYAEKVTEEQALKKAQRFFKDKRIESKNLRRAVSAGQQQGIKQDYYVFNAEDKGGFVIISGDDRTPEVLGYADSGKLDMNNLPPNLKGWLEEYSKQMKVLEESNNVGRRAPENTSRAAIEPLITTKWGQGSPYNNQCPVIDGKHCVTGCVATAMAQVMYYHKWPQDACAAIPQYTTATKQIEMPALPATTFKWSAMRDRYWEGEQGESAEAVAELMRYCGQAVEMNYNIDESGAFEMPRHLIQYFGYSKNAKYVTMSQYTMSQWEDILYKELSEGRPILYGGCSVALAHEFICDGYDGDGYYHFNWGWDGDANGFFLLSVMYNEMFFGGLVNGQTAIIGLQPNNAETTIPYIYGYHGDDLTKTEYTRSAIAEDFSEISLIEGAFIQYEIAEDQNVSIDYGLGLYKDTQFLTVLDQASAVLNVNNNTIYKQTNIAFGKDLEDGVYQIRHICKLTGNTEWETCADSYINYIVATISANSLSLRKVSDSGTGNAIYTINSISIQGNIATVNLTNIGDTNQEMLFIWTRTENGGLAFMDSSCGAIEPGKSGNVIFPVHFGGENISILITADPSGNRIMWEGNITSAERVEQQLTCSNLSIANLSNGILADSEAQISFTITNTGENIYNDVIGCDIQMLNNSEEGWSTVINRITQPVLINIGETKEIEFTIPHLESNRNYDLYFNYYSGIILKSFEHISLIVAKHRNYYDGLNYSYSPKSKTACVIPGEYQALESLTIPSTINIDNTSYSVTEIAPKTFERYNFQSICLPEGLLSIGRDAFMSCDIKSIYLPSTLKSIGQQAFYGVSGLKELVIPEGTTAIRMGTFEFCRDLEVLRLPSTISLIDESIVWGSEELKSVYVASPNPISIPERAFTTAVMNNGQILQVPQSATLYVPKGSVSKYQEAIGWNVFTRITDKLPYKLTYYVDGEVYKSYEVEEEASITPEPFPTKEGYNFSGWSEIPSTMPAHDVTVTGTFTIVDPVTVTATSYSRKYGESNPTFEYTSTGATLNGIPSISCEATETSPVGEYPIVITKGSVTNYNDHYVNGKLTITKAPLTITAKSYTIKQGDALPTFEAEYSGFKNNETSAVLTTQPTIRTTATSASAPGTYEIVVSGAEATNYDITYVKGTLTITKADEVVVTAKSYSRKYGEANPAFEYTTSGATLTGTPSISCEATATSPVGEYDIVVSKGSITNYNVTLENGKLTVMKAPLTITAKSYTIKQGDALPTFEADYAGFKNNETDEVLTKKPTITTTATSASAPGTYEIVVSGASANNYDITYVKGTLTITPADAIIVTAKSYSREYGEANPSLEYTVSGGTLTGTPSISCSATATSSVGEYDIVVSKGSITNYNVTLVNGKLTVTKAPLTITAKNYSIKQGESLPTFEAEYSGFKNNETNSVLTTQPTIRTTATSASEPGTYDIVVADASATNYAIEYVKGTLTISAVEVEPVTETGTTTFSEEVNENTDLSNTIIDNTYYTMNAENGDGYDATEQAIVLNSTTTAEQMNTVQNAKIGDATMQSNYNGIVFEVPAGNGTITVEAKTLGSHVLNVQIGKGEPTKITKSERGTVDVPYNVATPTYVYLYASTSGSSSAPKRAAAANSLLLYSYKVTVTVNGISVVTYDDLENAKWYTTDGLQLQGKPTKKGLYIVNGCKVVVK